MTSFGAALARSTRPVTCSAASTVSPSHSPMVAPSDWLVACASRWNVAWTSGVTEIVSRIRSGAFAGEGDFIGAVCTNLHQAVQGATTYVRPHPHEPANDQGAAGAHADRGDRAHGRRHGDRAGSFR